MCSDYRYSFNGKEDDGDWGTQNIQDYGFRLYNPSIGKFLSVDPLAPDYPELTTYQFASNRPIDGIDLDGLEFLDADESLIELIGGSVRIKIKNASNPSKYRYYSKNNVITRTGADGETMTTMSVSLDIARFRLGSPKQENANRRTSRGGLGGPTERERENGLIGENGERISKTRNPSGSGKDRRKARRAMERSGEISNSSANYDPNLPRVIQPSPVGKAGAKGAIIVWAANEIGQWGIRKLVERDIRVAQEQLARYGKLSISITLDNIDLIPEKFQGDMATIIDVANYVLQGELTRYSDIESISPYTLEDKKLLEDAGKAIYDKYQNAIQENLGKAIEKFMEEEGRQRSN